MDDKDVAKWAKVMAHMTPEEQKAFTKQAIREAEEAFTAADPTRHYVSGSNLTAWENTSCTYMSADNPYKRFFMPAWQQQPPMTTYDNTLPAWMQPEQKK